MSHYLMNVYVLFCRTHIFHVACSDPSDQILMVRETAALRVGLHMLLVLFVLLMHRSDVNVHERFIGSNTITSVGVVLPLWLSQLVQMHTTKKTSSPVGSSVTLQSGWKSGV